MIRIIKIPNQICFANIGTIAKINQTIKASVPNFKAYHCGLVPEWRKTERSSHWLIKNDMYCIIFHPCVINKSMDTAEMIMI